MGGRSTYRVDIKGKDQSARAFASVNGRIKGLKAASAGLTAILGPLAAAAASAGLAKMGMDALEAADRISKLSDRLGLSTETLSAYDFVAKRSGTSLETMAKAVQYLQKSIVDAGDGLTTATRAFDKLGLKAEDLKRMSPEEAFLTVGDALSKLSNQADKTQVSMGVLGRAGVEMNQVFKDGRAPVDALIQKNKELGNVLTEEMADKAARAMDAMADLEIAANGLKTSLAILMAEPVTKFFDGIAGAVADVNKGFDDSAKRAEMSAYLKTLSDEQKKTFAEIRKDAAGTDYYETAINALKQMGIEYGKVYNLINDNPIGPLSPENSGTLTSGITITPAPVFEKPGALTAMEEAGFALDEFDRKQQVLELFHKLAEDGAASLNDSLIPAIEGAGDAVGETGDAIILAQTRIDSALEDGVRGFGRALTDVAMGTTSAIDAMEQAAISAAQSILDAFVQAGIDDLLAKYAPSILYGSPVGPDLGPGVQGPPNPNKAAASLSGPQTVVNFNVSALDGPSAVNALRENQDAIVGVVIDGMKKYGRRL